MGITYRIGREKRLSVQEMDSNFRYIEEMITGLTSSINNGVNGSFDMLLLVNGAPRPTTFNFTNGILATYSLVEQDFFQYRRSIPYYLDFMDDERLMPTYQDLITFDSSEDDRMTTYRAGRDAFNKNYNEVLLEQYKQPNTILPLPEPTFHTDYGTYSKSTLFYKGPLKMKNFTYFVRAIDIDTPISWDPSLNFDANLEFLIPDLSDYLDPATVLNQADRFRLTWSTPINNISLWTNPNLGLSASSVLPGIEDVRIIDQLEFIESLPTTGEPGDIIYRKPLDPLESSGIWYAWDQSTNQFSESFYLDYLDYLMFTRYARRDALMKATNELSLAISPFLWTANYLPSFWVNKDLI